ncbi:MAG TPA: hemolysin III family protein [Ramlibacter sp.]|nr:hemolysin III family protein [Ramlibacter sp.]
MPAGERFNGYSHLLGLLLAAAGTVFLLGKTLGGDDIARTWAALVFSLSMLALYAASTLFHGTRGRAKLLWQRADHCAIYLLIAGTYTPLALVTLQGTTGVVLLCAVWAAAAGGIARELRSGEGARPSLAIYVGMGWLGLLAGAPIVSRLEAGALAWLLVGAVLYTAGTVFYRNPGGIRHAHGTWHLFVLAGTVSHYVAVAGYIL